MSDHVLKASVRQTLAYIEAYDADLLRAIEASFKEALLNCNGEDEDEDEDENIATKVQAAPASSEAPAAPPPPRSSAAAHSQTDQDTQCGYIRNCRTA